MSPGLTGSTRGLGAGMPPALTDAGAKVMIHGQSHGDVSDEDRNGVLHLCQAAGRHLLRHGFGKIINIASMRSFQGGIRVPAYAAAKGAVGGGWLAR